MISCSETAPIDDRGLLLGDGLFETILWRDGQAVRLPQHLERLRRGCGVLGLTAPDQLGLAAAVEAQGRASGHQRAAIRVTLTAGSGGRGLDRPQPPTPRLLISVTASAKPGGPARLATAGVRRNDRSPASRLKSLAYLDNVLAREQARAAGADEALMLNTADHLACGAAANLFWVRDGRLFTPALSCGVLEGVMRGAVIEAAGELGVQAVELAAPAATLFQADAVFLTNSLIGVRQVSSLDGHELAPGGLAQRLANLDL